MRRPLAAVLCALVVCTIAAPAFAQSPTPAPEMTPITAPFAMLVNVSNDSQILFSRDAHAQRAPASTTKIITALVAREEYALDDVVTATPEVLNTGGSDLNLEPGMQMTVRDLLYALLLKSANDAAFALAAHHPLGYAHFIKLMDQKARALGANDSQFKNPHGLDEPGHYTSAYDLAIFARSLLFDPVLGPIVGTERQTIAWKDGGVRIMVNHNKLIARDGDVLGVKTGFTDDAGQCLVAAKRTPAGVMLTVVMKSEDIYADSNSLFLRGVAITNGTLAGGGGGGSGERLALPPEAPTDNAVAAVLSGGWDPRDEGWWTYVLLVCALLAIATLVRGRRRHPLARAADVHPWLEPLVPPDVR